MTEKEKIMELTEFFYDYGIAKQWLKDLFLAQERHVQEITDNIFNQLKGFIYALECVGKINEETKTRLYNLLWDLTY